MQSVGGLRVYTPGRPPLDPADLVEVHGAPATDGVTVDATKIEFEP
ncbi:MAG: hypothetical protein KF786_16740 [Burkholderiaceae bacterium]|jgi:hypothetical protein|nr:hypothetical protein [Burkholderiaceae bacterium]